MINVVDVVCDGAIIADNDMFGVMLYYVVAIDVDVDVLVVVVYV